MKDKPMYGVLFANGKDIKLLMTREEDTYVIHGWKTKAAALAYFTDSYNRNHNRGYEASMSACWNFIEFGPRVFKIPSIEFIKTQVITDEPRLESIRGLSGSYMVLACRPEAKAVYDKATTPTLITPKSVVNS